MPHIAVIPNERLLRHLGNCVSALLCCQYFAVAVTANREQDVYDLASVTQRPVLDQGDWLVTNGAVNWALLGEQAVPVLEEKYHMFMKFRQTLKVVQNVVQNPQDEIVVRKRCAWCQCAV